MAVYWPLGVGRIVTSPFGQRAGGFHTGTDFGRAGSSANMPVYAVQDGTVIYCGAASGYGGPDPAGWIVVQSDDSQGGGCWEYGHIVRLPFIKPGHKVRAGEQIAFINPNSSTNGGCDPHLHVSFMPGKYNPSEKRNPMPRFANAVEPGSVVVKDVSVAEIKKPDFNEYWVSSPNFSSRGGKKVDLFLLHTQEGNGNADSLARYLADSKNKVSYHYTVSQDPRDNGVTLCDVVDTDEASWSVLSANQRSINLCFAGSSASWTREQWMAQSKAIRCAAYVAVQDCRKYGIPIRVLSPPYSSPPPGISDHKYVTQYLKDGSHTDVGANFPWWFFKQCVEEYAGYAGVDKPEPAQTPPPEPKTEPKPPAKPGPKPFQYPSHDEMLVQVWEQLLGPKGKGWPQLGNKTLVDAVSDLLKAKK